MTFEFSISKLGYTEIFMETCRKENLIHFFGHFWLVEAKMKMKMKKHEKMSSIFNFSISKLGYVAIFMKIGSFLNNRGKNEVEDENLWEDEFDF